MTTGPKFVCLNKSTGDFNPNTDTFDTMEDAVEEASARVDEDGDSFLVARVVAEALPYRNEPAPEPEPPCDEAPSRLATLYRLRDLLQQLHDSIPDETQNVVDPEPDEDPIQAALRRIRELRSEPQPEPPKPTLIQNLIEEAESYGSSRLAYHLKVMHAMINCVDQLVEHSTPEETCGSLHSLWQREWLTALARYNSTSPELID